MANDQGLPSDDILAQYGIDEQSVYNETADQTETPSPAPTPVDVTDTAPTPEPAQPPATRQVALPNMDQFIEEEAELYETALGVYRTALESSNEKVRMAAAKDVVGIYTKRRELDLKGPTGAGDTNNTQINITVESVQRALDSALYGMQGGMKNVTHNEEAQDADDPADSQPFKFGAGSGTTLSGGQS